MDFEEFTLRYELTRRQRLIPHLRIWAAHGPAAFAVVPAMIFAVAAALFAAPFPKGLIALPLFSLVLIPLILLFKGFFGGLLNVLLFRTHAMDVIVKHDAIGVLILGQRLWFSLDRTLSFKQYTADTWTLYHHSGQIVTIPSSELTDEQVEHLRGWVEESAARCSRSIGAPQLENVSRWPQIKCYTSKIKLLGLVAATLVLFGTFYFLTTLPGLAARAIGWMGVGLFGLVLIVALPRELLHKGPQVVINDEGIEDRRQSIGVIRWEDIRELAIWTLGSSKFLGIEVADPEVYLSRRPRRKRWGEGVSKAMGYPTLEIHFAALSPSLMEVWAQLEGRAAVDADGQPAAP